MYKPERHPLNADGDFFVEYNACLACDAPRAQAPELMAYDSDGQCYFKRQPQTPDEVENAISAVRVSCIEAVLYEGNDPDIIAKIRQMPCGSDAELPLQTFWSGFGDKVIKALRKFLDR